MIDASDFLTVEILPNHGGTPPGKLADAELIFHEGALAGMKLIGFAIWERIRFSPTGNEPPVVTLNVTYPARSYAVNGERRSFALLRPANGVGSNRVREKILEAYAAFVAANEAHEAGAAQ